MMMLSSCLLDPLCALEVHNLQAHPPENLAGLHSALVSAYVAQARVSDLVDLPDDGYILQTLGHHLTWAQRLDELKDLLCNPDWLEAKLHGYGTINVVADFRRYPRIMAKHPCLHHLQLAM